VRKDIKENDVPIRAKKEKKLNFFDISLPKIKNRHKENTKKEKMLGGVKRDESKVNPVFIVEIVNGKTQISDYLSQRNKNERILVSSTGVELYYCSWHSELHQRCMTNQELRSAIEKSVDGASSYSIWNCNGGCWDECKVNNQHQEIRDDKLEARLRSVEKDIAEKQSTIANMAKTHRSTREEKKKVSDELILLTNQITDLEHNYKNSNVKQDLEASRNKRDLLENDLKIKEAKALKMWESFLATHSYRDNEEEQEAMTAFFNGISFLTNARAEIAPLREKVNNLTLQEKMLKTKYDNELAVLKEKSMRLKESILAMDKTLEEDFKYPLYEIMEGLRIFTELQKNELKEFLRKQKMFLVINKASPEYLFWEKYLPLRKSWVEEKREITKNMDDDEVERVYAEVKKEKDSAAAEVKALKEEGGKISNVVKGVRGKILVAGSKKVVTVGNMRQITAIPISTPAPVSVVEEVSVRDWRKEEEVFPESRERERDLQRETEEEVAKQWQAFDYAERYEREEANRERESAYRQRDTGGGSRTRKVKHGGER
jgi:hypothetical protein